MKMRYIPGRTAIGTTRRIARTVFGNDAPKDHKGRPVPEEYATDAFFGWLGRQFDKLIASLESKEDKQAIKLARQEYFERYGHYPPGNPRG